MRKILSFVKQVNKMAAPKVSICIPAYKRPELMRVCLESIRKQTYADYEVVITDDSPDDTVGDVAREFKDKIKCLRYYKNETQKGSPENWNECVSRAAGEYIKMVHCDDSFSDEKSLSKYVLMLDENPDTNFAFSSSKVCNKDSEITSIYKPDLNRVNHLSKDIGSLFGCNFIGAPSAIIYRKNNISFDKNLKWLVDIDFYMALLKVNPKFVYIEEPLIVISSESDSKVTNECAGDKCTEFREYLYVYRKAIENGIIMGVIRPLRVFQSLIKGYNIQGVQELASCNLLNKISFQIRVLMMIQRIMNSYGLAERIQKNGYKKLIKDTFFYKLYLSIFNGKNKWKPKVSYSQCGEDLIMEFIFNWLKITKPSYLDIGANEPIKISNTYYFYKKGSHGVLIEPNPALCANLKSKRERDVCLNVGIGFGGKATLADFYVMSVDTLSTFSKKEAERYVEYGNKEIKEIKEIKLIPVNDVLKEYFVRVPNFVSLDTEGNDLKILQSWDWDLYRPEVFCIETLTYTENNTEVKLMDIIEFMESKNYKVYADTYINTIFVDNEAWGKR